MSLCHAATAPMGLTLRGCVQRLIDDGFDRLSTDLGFTTTTGFDPRECIYAFSLEALAPLQHGRSRNVELFGDRRIGHALGGVENNLRTQRKLLWRFMRVDLSFKY